MNRIYSHEEKCNTLFPVFLKLEDLRLLIIGGGRVAFEKLNAMLQNAPATSVTVVGMSISDEIIRLAANYDIAFDHTYYKPGHLDKADIIIVAVNDKELSQIIWNDARNKGKLLNVADTPDMCHFYLGSVVQKGNLKIAISTNGKSPTIAKRVKEELQVYIPDDIDLLLDNMSIIRSNLKGDFAFKVKKLNKITDKMITTKSFKAKWPPNYSSIFILLGLVGLLLACNIVLYYSNTANLLSTVWTYVKTIDSQFYFMILAGFVAQMVDGAIGMGYGVTCTSILLSMGVSITAISRSVNTAKIFSIGSSGYKHYKLGNVNRKLFRAMVIPGILGAITGAYLLVKLGDEYSKYVRPVLAIYTLFLGIRIFLLAFKKSKSIKKVKRVGWLAAAGGFVDAFGGGGWGPLVTSKLISKGRTPRMVIGSVNITEAFVACASVVTFFLLMGISHWHVIAGLIIGGLLAAPLAAKISGKLPIKVMLIIVGSFVVFWSINVLVHLK